MCFKYAWMGPRQPSSEMSGPTRAATPYKLLSSSEITIERAHRQQIVLLYHIHHKLIPLSTPLECSNAPQQPFCQPPLATLIPLFQKMRIPAVPHLICHATSSTWAARCVPGLPMPLSFSSSTSRGLLFYICVPCICALRYATHKRVRRPTLQYPHAPVKTITYCPQQL